MASITMTRVQFLSPIVLLLAVALVGVQGRQDPHATPCWITHTCPEDFPDRRPLYANPSTESTHFESHPTNVDESQFWGSAKNADVAGGSKLQPSPRGATAAYNYALEGPKFDESQFRASGKTRGGKSTERPGDETEILWVSEPRFTTPEELARFGGMQELTTEGAGESKVRPGAQRTEVQRTDVQPAMFDESTESWEAGPWGTKHRPGAESSLVYVGFGEAAQAGGSKELPGSHNP